MKLALDLLWHKLIARPALLFCLPESWQSNYCGVQFLNENYAEVQPENGRFWLFCCCVLLLLWVCYWSVMLSCVAVRWNTELSPRTSASLQYEPYGSSGRSEPSTEFPVSSPISCLNPRAFHTKQTDRQTDRHTHTHTHTHTYAHTHTHTRARARDMNVRGSCCSKVKLEHTNFFKSSKTPDLDFSLFTLARFLSFFPSSFFLALFLPSLSLSLCASLSHHEKKEQKEKVTRHTRTHTLSLTLSSRCAHIEEGIVMSRRNFISVASKNQSNSWARTKTDCAPRPDNGWVKVISRLHRCLGLPGGRLYVAAWKEAVHFAKLNWVLLSRLNVWRSSSCKFPQFSRGSSNVGTANGKRILGCANRNVWIFELSRPSHTDDIKGKTRTCPVNADVWIVLTPLLSFSGMRILVMLLLDTLPMLGNVLLLCFFVFFIFGIIGVQLWAGLLRQRCFLDLPENISYFPWVTPCFLFLPLKRVSFFAGNSNNSDLSEIYRRLFLVDSMQNLHTGRSIALAMCEE